MVRDTKTLEKQYLNYIEGVNLDKIEFKRFNYNELQEFLLLNYYDFNSNSIVAWNVDGFIHPLGMDYLEFSIPCKDNFYIIGLVDNKVGKKTIVFCLEYNDNYEINLEEESVAYITFLETNYYFRGKGVLRKAFEYIKQEFDKYSVLVTTSMSEDGKKIDLFNKMVELFKDSNVSVKIEEDDCNLIRR